MAKNQTPYIFSTTKLRINQIFKDLNALFLAVTGRSLPEGKQNRDIVINNLKRYLEYDFTSNIDPTIKLKRSVTITQIYSPPLEKIEMRGRHGKYIDNVRPLLLQKGSFSGKKYVLYNQLGLFSKYFDTIKNTDEVREAIKICGYMEYDIWKEHKDAYSGENEYRSVIKNQLWRITKSALDSMEKSGIIEWRQYYVILPDLTVFLETNDEIEELSGSYKELEAQNKKYLEAIRERATAENSILQFSLASSLLIGGNLASDKEYYDECKYLLQIHQGQEFTIDDEIIASGYDNYDAAISRAGFATILNGALPDTALPAINSVEGNAIPDVDAGSNYYNATYRLYRAGILTGNDSAGTFAPFSKITRGAAAAIVSRMANTDLRKNITLKALVNPTSVTLSVTTQTIYVGKGFGLSATISPVNVPNKAVAWSSSNRSVATVDASGYVYGVATGTTTITATTANGKMATCKVIVTATTSRDTLFAKSAYSHLKSNLKFPETLKVYNVWAYDLDEFRKIEIEYSAENNYGQAVRSFYIATFTSSGDLYFEKSSTSSPHMASDFLGSNVVSLGVTSIK